MERKTQGVYELVEEVLRNIPQPFGEDIIEDVCLIIEHDNQLYSRYQNLCTDSRQWVVNKRDWIGQYIKIIKETIREVTAQRSKIISSYSKLAQ
jgi:hypothetical protein